MNKVYIIAEVGPNHQGSVDLAIKYVKKISKIGVDAIKFQIGVAEEHYSQTLSSLNKKNIKDNLILFIKQKN